MMAEGARSFSGRGEHILGQLRVLGEMWRRAGRSVLVIADGARWIRAFFTTALAEQPGATLLLDWYLCWPFGSSARSEGPVPSQGGSVITSETHVSKGGVQGYVHSFRGRMSQTASTAVVSLTPKK